MDFIENIGQSYLERKANQAPYQLENFAKKQLFGGSGAEKEAAGKSGAASQAGGNRAGSAAPSKKASAGGNDAEVAKLRKELEAYKLGEGKSGSGKSAASTKGKGSVGPTEVSKAKSSSASKSKDLDSRIEKGKISTKPKRQLETPKRGSKVAKGAAGLAALDGRLEKGGISTRKKSKAFAEVDAMEAGKHGKSTRAQSPDSSEESEEESEDESVHRERSASRTSEAARSRKHSAAAYSEPLSPRALSSRGPASSASTARGRSVGHGSPGPKAPSSRISMDEESEHGGSAALLHQRQKYRRRSSLGRVPEIPPLEQRPEVVGEGFRPHRSPVGREVGIVEVYEETPRRAPKAREIERRHEHGSSGGRDRGVVEVRSDRDGRTLYKVR